MPTNRYCSWAVELLTSKQSQVSGQLQALRSREREAGLCSGELRSETAFPAESRNAVVLSAERAVFCPQESSKGHHTWLLKQLLLAKLCL